MAINSTRLALLRDEYENSSITIEDLCVYHQVQPADLKGYTKWKKKHIATEPNLTDHLLDIPDEPIVVGEVVVDDNPKQLPASQPQEQQPTIVEPLDMDQLVIDIKECKVEAIKRCKEFLINDAKHAEVKEIKDIVSIVTDIDKSISGVKQPTGNSVTILISNIIANFKDDC